jgi:multidrug resistance efflux pump
MSAWQMMQRQIELAGSPAPRAISFDVLPMGAGNKFRLVVSDLDLERPVWVGDGGRKEADCDLFFKTLGEVKSARLELVVMDTWKPFRRSVLKNAPQARIFHDRFHLTQNLSKALDEVRRHEYKQLRSEKGLYSRGAFYTLLSLRENLNLDGSEAQKKRLTANRRLYTAYILKETFGQLWDYRTESAALAFFERWKEGLKRQRLEPYLKFAELVESHWEGVGAYYHSGNNIRPDVVEDINNKLQVLQQQENDTSDEEYFKLKIIAAFLPPLPEEASARPQISTQPDSGAPRSALQHWFNLLCQMLPNVSRGAVVQVEQGVALPNTICWPADAAPSAELMQAAGEVITRAEPVIEGQIFAHPLRREGRLFAVASIELLVNKEQQGVVQQLLNWGEQWLLLLLGSASAAGGETADQENSRPDILPVLEQALTAEPLQAAVLAITNQLAGLFACERVALGLLQGKRIRLQGLSHGAEFDPRTKLIQELEAAMEAVRDSVSMALWPQGERTTSPALKQLGENDGQRSLCAVPLFGRESVIGVVLCERTEAGEFSTTEQEALTNAGRLLGPVLELKQEQSGALPRRAKQALEHSLDRLLKPGHRGFKVTLAGVLFTLSVLIFGQGTYRVSATASIEGLVQRAVVAPFDGYIAEADVRAGDTVSAGDVIARMDDRELLLELRRSTSEEERLNNEYRKALANLDRSEARIVQSRLAQVQAKSGLLQQKLERAQLRAPLGGVVIIGDLSRSLGAPVERGQVLFEVAPLDEYRLVLEVDEQEIANIEEGQLGSLSLTALPRERWRFVIDQVSPIFQEEDGQVSYRTEAHIEGGIEALRPGMEGVGKIEIGHRSFGWILFHKMLDWIRLQVWLWLP